MFTAKLLFSLPAFLICLHQLFTVMLAPLHMTPTVCYTSFFIHGAGLSQYRPHGKEVADRTLTENPLGQWRNMIQDLYDIKLKIPGDNTPKKR